MAPGPPKLGNNRFAPLAASPEPKRKKLAYTKLNFPDLPTIKKDIENPKFITISSTDTNKPLSKFSCFAVHRALEAISKDIKITELRDGNLLGLAKNELIANKFVTTKSLPGICKIEAKFHENLNCSKGTIFAPFLNNVEEEEIIENLKEQGVVSAYKFKKVKDGQLEPSGVLLLSFDLYRLPEKITVAWRKLAVKPYYPNPMRCKSCQRLGHTAKRCNNTPACITCNLPPHPAPCTRSFCANCSGDHPSNSNICPRYMQAKDILRIKCQEKCSMREAIKIHKAQTSAITDKSFAAAAKGAQPLSTTTISTTKTSSLPPKNTPTPLSSANTHSPDQSLSVTNMHARQDQQKTTQTFNTSQTTNSSNPHDHTTTFQQQQNTLNLQNSPHINILQQQVTTNTSICASPPNQQQNPPNNSFELIISDDDS